MFIYFNQNKLAYHKGQLVPFFIVFIVVLLIAALVTVNIGKVGLIKTYSSNAADAGALAGGSVMATVFNTQALMNSEMIVAYEMFYALMAVQVGIIIAAMWVAASTCMGTPPCYCCGYGCPCDSCCPQPLCHTSTGYAIVGLKAAIVALIAFQVKQFFYYKIMKEQAMDGRDSAIEVAYRYAFLNSGISSKLKSCRLEDTGLCDDCEDDCERDCKQECGDDNNCLDACSREELTCLVDNCQSQQAEFQLWLKDIGSVPTAEYTWLDGQERNHQVYVGIDTHDVGTYKLKLPALPTAALVALLYVAYGVAVASAVSCNCCPLLSGGMTLAAKYVTLDTLAVLAGLIPAWDFDASGLAMVMFPICWVTEIDHNRLLAVTTRQEHEGEDYGVMGQTAYPRIESYSQVDFRGNGKIYRPDPYFDATIIKTDASGN